MINEVIFQVGPGLVNFKVSRDYSTNLFSIFPNGNATLTLDNKDTFEVSVDAEGHVSLGHGNLTIKPSMGSVLQLDPIWARSVLVIKSGDAPPRIWDEDEDEDEDESPRTYEGEDDEDDAPPLLCGDDEDDAPSKV